MCKNWTVNTESEITPFCAEYHHAVELIGRRWSGAVLRALLAGLTRYSALARAGPGLGDRMLSERLRELEAEGIVTRTVYPTTPVCIEYHLTDKGRDLMSVIQAIGAWAERWAAVPPAEPVM